MKDVGEGGEGPTTKNPNKHRERERERERREREMGKGERESVVGVCARNTESANQSVGEEIEVGNSNKCKRSYFLGDLKFNLYDLDLLKNKANKSLTWSNNSIYMIWLYLKIK